MNLFKRLLPALLLTGCLVSTTQALVPVGIPTILSTEWQVNMDNMSPGQAITTQLTLINIAPEIPGMPTIDVYIIAYDNKEKPIGFFVVSQLSPRDITVLDCYTDLALPMGKGVIAMVAFPTGMTPDNPNAQPLTNVFDGYLTQKVYNLAPALQLLGNGKTGFLGSFTGDFSEFKGRSWHSAPNN